MRWLRHLFTFPHAQEANQIRWVIVDCESSGLDPGTDRLLSIGAVALEKGQISVAGGFSVFVRQAIPSEASNIAIHGVTDRQQLSGVEQASALRSFADFAGEQPLVAYHARFDKTLLLRAAHSAGTRLRNPWLDLAELAPVLYPEQATRCRALDDWLDHFGIPGTGRHDALSDAFATAQFFQILLSSARAQGAVTVRELLAAARARRWLKV